MPKKDSKKPVKPTKPTKPTKLSRKHTPKQTSRVGNNVREYARASYACPVDGTIGRLLTLGRNNRWLCECPRDHHRWYAPAEAIA